MRLPLLGAGREARALRGQRRPSEPRRLGSSPSASAMPGDEKGDSRLPYAGPMVLLHVHAALAGVPDVIQGEELQREARGGDRLAAGPGMLHRTAAPRGAWELPLRRQD